MQNNYLPQSQKTQGVQTSKLRFVVYVLFAFILLYQPPLPVSIIYLITAVSWFYLFFMKQMNGFQGWVLLLVGILMASYLLIVVVIKVEPISHVSKYFWLIVCVIPACCAFSIFVEHSRKTLDDLLHILLFAAIIQAVLAYMCFFSEEIQESFFQYMMKTGLYEQDHLEKWGYRIYGYGISLMYSIPIVQAIIASWTFLYGIERGKTLYSVTAILILLSAVINAKIAMPVFLVSTGLSLLMGFKQFQSRFFRILSIGVLSVLIVNWAYTYAQNTNGKLADWLGILVDEDRVSGYLYGYYLNAEKWVLPEGVGLFFGTGGERAVDMGIVRDIWMGGFLFIVFQACVLVHLVKRVRRNPIFPVEWQKMMAYSLLITFVIADLKGEAFSYMPFMMLFVLVAFFSGENGYVKLDKRA